LRVDAPAWGLGASAPQSSTRRSIRGGSVYLRYKHGGLRGAVGELRQAARYAGAAAVQGHWSNASADVRGIVDGLTMCWRGPRQ
jgi:hypothetical protein